MASNYHWEELFRAAFSKRGQTDTLLILRTGPGMSLRSVDAPPGAVERTVSSVETQLHGMPPTVVTDGTPDLVAVNEGASGGN